MAEVDPDAEHGEDRGRYYDDEPESNWQFLRRLWDTALEEEADAPPLPRPTPPPLPPVPAEQNLRARNDDPWSSDASSLSDEPPF